MSVSHGTDNLQQLTVIDSMQFICCSENKSSQKCQIFHMKICFLSAIINLFLSFANEVFFFIKECQAILKNNVCGNHVLN